LDNPRLQPIGSAFARIARRSMLAFATITVALCSLVGKWWMDGQWQRALSREAHLYAAVLAAEPNSDLSNAAAMLQSRSDRVIAVATVDSAGILDAVYPDQPAYRRAAIAALEHPGSVVQTFSSRTGDLIPATGIIVPSNGSSALSASKILVLLQSDSHTASWLIAKAMAVFVVVLTALGTARYLRRWFDRSVAGPLRTMAGAVDDRATTDNSSGPQPEGWLETAKIACRLQELKKTLSEYEERARRLEREAQIQIRQTEIGFGRQLRRARDQASTDPLTGLRNRAYLGEHLEAMYEEHAAENAELSAVMIDVDNFKNYNDTQGHQGGDALLRFIGALFRGSIRPTDVAVRFGGDEFLLLLPEATAQQAAVIAERLVKLFGQYAGRLDQKPPVSMSAGVASLRADGCESGHALINRADAALYDAKRRGKNMVAVAAPSAQPPPEPNTAPSTDDLRETVACLPISDGHL